MKTLQISSTSAASSTTIGSDTLLLIVGLVLCRSCWFAFDGAHKPACPSCGGPRPVEGWAAMPYRGEDGVVLTEPIEHTRDEAVFRGFRISGHPTAPIELIRVPRCPSPRSATKQPRPIPIEEFPLQPATALDHRAPPGFSGAGSGATESRLGRAVWTDDSPRGRVIVAIFTTLLAFAVGFGVHAALVSRTSEQPPRVSIDPSCPIR